VLLVIALCAFLRLGLASFISEKKQRDAVLFQFSVLPPEEGGLD
jgi:hypothetical protein